MDCGDEAEGAAALARAAYSVPPLTRSGNPQETHINFLTTLNVPPYNYGSPTKATGSRPLHLGAPMPCGLHFLLFPAVVPWLRISLELARLRSEA